MAERASTGGAKNAVIVLSVMAAIWCVLASSALPASWHIPTIVAAVLISGLLIAGYGKRTSGSSNLNKKIFWSSVGFEAVAIPVAIYFLTTVHGTAFILATIAIIVGLHFIGMWLATGRRDYLVVCVAMCALGLAAIFSSPPWRMQIAGFGSALTLWIAAFRLSCRA